MGAQPLIASTKLDFLIAAVSLKPEIGGRMNLSSLLKTLNWNIICSAASDQIGLLVTLDNNKKKSYYHIRLVTDRVRINNPKSQTEIWPP